ncbi:MAG: hypothetical protein WB778_10205 [Thermoplasmata archaeon]
MTEETTENRVELEQPYRAVGIFMAVVSFIILGFTLGVLARCGGGSGVCFDPSTHAAGAAGLVLFVIFLIIGVALIAYTGSATTFSTRTSIPEVPTPPASTTVVLPQAAVMAQPAVTNVYPQAPVAPEAPIAPTTTVVVAPPS